MVDGNVITIHLSVILLVSLSDANLDDGIPTFAEFSSCSTICRCSYDEVGKISVKCNFSGKSISEEELQIPPDVYTLDLSNNNFLSIPLSTFRIYSNITNLIFDDNGLQNITAQGSLDTFSFLKYLSFQRNSIKTVHSDFFRGLKRLRHLNMGLNNMNRWSGNQTYNTPNLQFLDITGTNDWVPDENILALPKLQELRGVTWCRFCPNCTVINPSNLANDSERRRKAEKCLKEFDEMKFLEFGKKEPKRFIKYRYLPECMCVKQSECEFRHIVMPYYKKRTSLPQHLFYVEYFLSPFTILLNMVVILTVVTSSSLRKTPSFVLIVHTGIIDLLIGVYAIWVAHTNISNVDSILEEIMWTGKELQPSTGPIFISGQLISVSISLLLTLERYLAVVYCMTPAKLMSANNAHISLFFAWGVAVAFAVLPIFGVGGLHYNIERACTPLSYDEQFHTGSSLILLTSLAVILLLYMTTLPLYIHLFRFVKKSSSQVGVKRELSLARKIALLVFTNFIFFAIPIILILVFSIFAKLDSNPFDFEGDAFKSTVFKIAIGQWLPVTCLNINSLLDPFLYAFRHAQFKREINRKLKRYSNKVFPNLPSMAVLHSVGDFTSQQTATQTRKISKIEYQNTGSNNIKNTPIHSASEELEFKEIEQ